MTDAGRPQDQGRPHRRRGAPSAETVTLLAEYQTAMRSELRDILRELRGKPPGLMPDAPVERPSLTDRGRLWDLAIKVGRELGTEVDPTPAPGETGPTARAGGPRSRRRVDYG